MTGHEDWFSSLDKGSNLDQVHLGDDIPYDIEGKGDMHVHIGKYNYQISEVLYVPGLAKNLFSISQMLDCNLKVKFDIMKGENVCLILDKSKNYQIVARVVGIENMFLLDNISSNNQVVNAHVVHVTKLWHR